MAVVTVPPPPSYNDEFNSYEWQEWFRLAHYRINENGQFVFDQIDGNFPWTRLNFSGSSLSDLETRSHDLLAGLDYDSSGHIGFARLEGDSTQSFEVDTASLDTEAVPKLQAEQIANAAASETSRKVLGIESVREWDIWKAVDQVDNLDLGNVVIDTSPFSAENVLERKIDLATDLGDTADLGSI